MEKFISVNNLLKEAQKKGIDLGKGDPYNRLRYYTKIGWITHMVRRKNEKGKIVGHYPITTLSRLETINELKDKGLSNDEITTELEKLKNKKTISNVISKFDLKRKAITYGTFILIFIIFLSEMGIINVGKTKDSRAIVQSLENIEQDVRLVDSGRAFVPRGQAKIFVKTDKVSSNSKIYLTFRDDYSPATRFWVSDQEVTEGFLVELDAPTFANAEFDWWISF